MSGTLAGGLKARDTNKAKYGKSFYSDIARIGGSRGAKDGVIKGFAANRELARTAGAKGGYKSRRGKAKVAQTTRHYGEVRVVSNTPPIIYVDTTDERVPHKSLWQRIKEGFNS